MSAPKEPRVVKLQINLRGAWRDALKFDLNEVDGDDVKAAAAHLVRLADPSGKTMLRIAIADGLQTALMRWDAKNGWVVA